MLPIRYMGTKRHIAHRVCRVIEDLDREGPVVDLFAGTGSVAKSLAGRRSVITNDALSFAAELARARFTGECRSMTPHEAVHGLRPLYRDHLHAALNAQRDRLKLEQRVLDGDQDALMAYMSGVEHVGNSEVAQQAASTASRAVGADRYCLVSVYFAAGYFSLRQAIQLDAIRFAIDTVVRSPIDRSWLLASWIATAATIVNAPGHTAQHLKATTETGCVRVRRNWRRDAWEVFGDRLVDMGLVGDWDWRRGNHVMVSDALDVLNGERLRNAGVIYADPPYTRDQYSRYYHVYETLYRYDFPASTGQGRIRADRFTTGFSLKSGVVTAFTQMFEAIVRLGVPLVLSYPTDGLLTTAGATVRGVAKPFVAIDTVESFGAKHSTMGASKGSKFKSATENIYVCRPV